MLIHSTVSPLLLEKLFMEPLGLQSHEIRNAGWPELLSFMLPMLRKILNLSPVNHADTLMSSLAAAQRWGITQAYLLDFLRGDWFILGIDCSFSHNDNIQPLFPSTVLRKQKIRTPKIYNLFFMVANPEKCVPNGNGFFPGRNHCLTWGFLSNPQSRWKVPLWGLRELVV